MPGTTPASLRSNEDANSSMDGFLLSGIEIMQNIVLVPGIGCRKNSVEDQEGQIVGASKG